MIEKDVYVNLAKANATAIHGLQPKINVWNTGSSDGADSGAPIRNLFQALPPLFSTIHDQTGMSPPAWMGFQPDSQAVTKPGQASQQQQQKPQTFSK